MGTVSFVGAGGREPEACTFCEEEKPWGLAFCKYVAGVVVKPSAAWGKKRHKRNKSSRTGGQVNRSRVQGPATQRFGRPDVYTKDPWPASALPSSGNVVP